MIWDWGIGNAADPGIDKMCFPIEDLYSGNLIVGEPELLWVAEDAEDYGVLKT